MNFLILSAGRRSALVNYFVKEFNGLGKIIVTDCDNLAPTLYIADKAYIVPKINDESYIDCIKSICLKENIKGMISLIDPELSLISSRIQEFEDLGVKWFLSSYDITEICFNKYKMYKFLKENGFRSAKSYIDFKSFKNDYDNNEVKMPVFVKPVCGSASININKVNTIEEVEFLMNKYDDLMVQEYLNGQEIGVDVYVDKISNEVISIFAKEKIRMRAGETDKSKSIKCDRLFNIIENFVNKLGVSGVIDIDVFRVNGEYYISELNPRFGGGYPHAYECGEDFIKLIKNNIMGIKNNKRIGYYKENVYAIKSDFLIVKEESELI